MLKQADLERLDLNMLAMYCLRVSESLAADSPEAEQARQLKNEWALFIGYPKSPSTESGTPEDSAAQAKLLKERMVRFLSGCSLNASLSTQPASPSNSNAQGAAAGRRK